MINLIISLLLQCFAGLGESWHIVRFQIHSNSVYEKFCSQ